MSIYCFDIDGTICSIVENRYDLAKPFLDVIARINKLKKEGHTIIFNTARGSVSDINWRPLTLAQLENWGVNYDKLYIGIKIHADVYIDDKAINAKAWRLTCGNV